MREYEMKLSWIKYLIVGVILVVIIFFSSIVIFNVVINKIPLPGMERQLLYEPISGFNYSLTYLNNVSANDHERSFLLSEDQAWEYAWSFYHNKKGMTLFLPLEKRSLGLHRLTDQQNHQYTVWGFNVIQNDHSVFFITGCTKGGIIDIDAYSGNILSFSEEC
jgi:hypothetical protein